MPYVEVTRSAAGSSYPTKAAFEADRVYDTHKEISFKEGCIRMGFYHRQNFRIELKRQRDMDAIGKTVTGVRIPEPHWKDGRQWFYLREVEAFTAATQGE